MLCGVSLPAQALAGVPHPCLTMPEAHQFDFWIGEWDVTPWQVKSPTPAQRMGFNDIHPILEHCVLSENWKATRGGEGKSYNYFDTNRGKRRQIWIADSGGRSTTRVSSRTARCVSPGGHGTRREIVSSRSSPSSRLRLIRCDSCSRRRVTAVRRGHPPSMDAT
jgi:hypothetical protein